MPIRPENRHRYPANWGEISRMIRTVRAGDRCECRGECKRGHRDRCSARNGADHPVTGSLVVLTVAHLDHTPENCDPANLRAMCQACHLSYDADHHAATRARTLATQQTAGMDPLFPDGAQTRLEPLPPALQAPAPTSPSDGVGAPAAESSLGGLDSAAAPAPLRPRGGAGAHNAPSAGYSGGGSAEGATTDPLGGGPVVITVIGHPAPQGSKRHVGRGVMVESSKKVKPWRDAVKAAISDYRQDAGLDSFRFDQGIPLVVKACFHFDKPKSAPKKRRVWPVTRSSGDVDKLLRSTFDALTDSGLIHDDSQIVTAVGIKVHTCDPDAFMAMPGAVILISPQPQGTAA